MARKKRSALPTVTEADRTDFPEQVRSTPNGGWAWKCHYCGRYACDVSVAGRYLCRCHGGSTPRQRCPEQDYLHRLTTGEGLKLPGRPIKLGFYCRKPGHSVQRLIDEYHERHTQAALYMRQVTSQMIQDCQRDVRNFHQARRKRT
jgi:hypothetical protein